MFTMDVGSERCILKPDEFRTFVKLVDKAWKQVEAAMEQVAAEPEPQPRTRLPRRVRPEAPAW